jgi:transposase
MEKLLEDAGIKLSVFVSDIFGVSGRAMLRALIDGERDPQVLAGCAQGRMRPTIPALVEALTGSFGEHHAFLCRTMLDRVDDLDTTINAVTVQIETGIAPFQAIVDRLDTIRGVNQRVAQVIVAEVGVDMTRSPPRAIWPAGRGCVRATTSRPASTSLVGLARATVGCAPRSARPPPPAPVRRTPTARRNTGTWPPGAARSERC